LFSCCQRAAENGFAADDRSVSGDGSSFRCCTVGEFSHDCDSVSVIAVQEKCDERRGRVRASCLAHGDGSKFFTTTLHLQTLTADAGMLAGSSRRICQEDKTYNLGVSDSNESENKCRKLGGIAPSDLINYN